MYQFGFFPLTSTACDKSLLNIQEQVLFNINRQFSFRKKLMSSCNLAKWLGGGGGGEDTADLESSHSKENRCFLFILLYLDIE